MPEKKGVGSQISDRRLLFRGGRHQQDLKALQETTIEDRSKTLAIRSECNGTYGKVSQAIGVAITLKIREMVLYDLCYQ